MGKRKTKNPLLSHKAERPVPYWLLVRVLDRRAGRVDGKHAMYAALLTMDADRQPSPDQPSNVSPYLGAIDRRYTSQTEMVRVMADVDVDPVLRRRVSVEHQIVIAEENLQSVRKELDAMPETAPEAELGLRSALEHSLGTDDMLVRVRNQRTWDAKRSVVVNRERQAAHALDALRQERAELVGAITARMKIAATRARRLHEHALRRHRTYERQLALRHPDGAALLPLLAITRPGLPDWAMQYGATQDGGAL